MAFLFKLLAMLISFASTTLLLFESARRGLLVLSTVLGVLKIIVFVAFLALLAVIAYLLFKSARSAQSETP